MSVLNIRNVAVKWYAGIYLFYPAVLTCLTGCAESVDHDENLAGRRAVEFAQIAFVKQDMEEGYARLSNAAKGYVPLAKFKETISRLHPEGYPTKVMASDYESIGNERALYIYLIGENARDHFYYLLTMEGTATSDYKVTIIDRKYAPYPPSPIRRPLGAKQ